MANTDRRYLQFGVQCSILFGIYLLNECPEYDTKQSDSEALENIEYPFIAIAPRSTLAWSDRNPIESYLWVK